jgi:two-component system response regulator MprA
MPTVFLADDDEPSRRLLARELEAVGYSVIQACDGAEALQRLASAADGAAPMPDAVVLDVCMPGISGLGVLSVMRRFRHPPPTFLMTGFSHESVDVVAERRGAVRIFHKPIDVEELLAAIRNVAPV